MVSTKSLLAAGLAALAVGGEAKKHRGVVKGAYVVEFADDADPSTFYNHIEGNALTRRNMTYSLFKGASIQFHDSDNAEHSAAAVSNLPGIKNVFPVRRYGIPKPRVHWTASAGASFDHHRKKRGDGQEDIFSTHVMTGVDLLHKEGFDGKGIKVAVIDSGIDYSHPALGGCFGEGCLVSFGADLVGDAYDGYTEPIPDDDPMDCGGHGTHVAGTIAAQFDQNPFGIAGAAPAVELGSYRVFGCDGSAQNDILIAAYHEAYESGADIITASIGGPSGWSGEEWTVAVSRIVEQGVPCLLAAGNDGAAGLWYASAAAGGKGVAAIASVNNVITPTLLRITSYSVDGGEDVPFGWVVGEPAVWVDSSLPVYATSNDTLVEDDACDPLSEDTPDLSDHIVLIRRGTCDYDTKATNAAAAGARYVLFYNNIPDAATDAFTLDEHVLGIAMTTSDAGEAMVQALAAGSSVVATMADPLTAELNLINVPNAETGGAMSEFTTWGPTYEGDAKPTFASVGGKILSTWPLALGGYAQISGTSMATPLAAGVYALLIQKRGTKDPQLLQNILVSTATPLQWNNGSQTFDGLAPVPQQGAGLINAYAAAHLNTVVSTTALAWNDTDNFVADQEFSIENLSDEDVTFVLNSVPALTAYTYLAEDDYFVSYFPMEVTDDAATITFNNNNVTVPAGGKATVRVTAAPPANIDESRLPVWSGYLTLNGTDGSALSLPYQGISGSLHSQQVISPAEDAVYLGAASAIEEIPNPARANASFLLPPKGSDWETGGAANFTLPAAVAVLKFGSRLVEVNIVPLSAGSSQLRCKRASNETTPLVGAVGIGMPEGYDAYWKPRGAVLAPWDGRLAGTTKYADPGAYKFVVRALKVFGDEDNEDDWETAETGAFTISYAK